MVDECVLMQKCSGSYSTILCIDSGAVGHDVANTIALGENSVTDADKDGVPVTVTLAGANGTGTIQLQMFYVID